MVLQSKLRWTVKQQQLDLGTAPTFKGHPHTMIYILQSRAGLHNTSLLSMTIFSIINFMILFIFLFLYPGFHIDFLANIICRQQLWHIPFFACVTNSTYKLKMLLFFFYLLKFTWYGAFDLYTYGCLVT